MIVYDIESYPNFFSVAAVSIDRDDLFFWEISDRRNDTASFIDWLMWLGSNNTEMIGFNNIFYDYTIIHHLMTNAECVTPLMLYEKTDAVINSGNRWEHNIWPSDRIVPQIDLFKIWHFDNKAKTQSLKGLQFNMRSETVEDLPFKPGTYLTPDQMETTLRYNGHDTLRTRDFARISLPAIEFRKKLLDNGTISGDVINFNDTKLGKELLSQRLGDICYERIDGRRSPRQTIRTRIPLRDVIFPYIRFEHPEFQRIHSWMLEQTLSPEDLDDPDGRASTKGVFKGVHATIDGFDFHFGTGGIHGSVNSAVYHSDETHVLVDADVASLYPSIAIVNRLYPEHLGELFVQEYAALKEERFKYAKGTPENGAFKLALNGTYGASNDIYSPFYDPLFTMKITINGQLMLCMLTEWLMKHVPGFELIQINTDGLTARIPRTSRDIYNIVCKEWEKYTLLDLEFVDYASMWIRDVNNYVAKDTKGKIKSKGAYWSPDLGDKYAASISNAGPPAWHKDLSAPIIQRAAVAYMTEGIPVEFYISTWHDPYDFMLRAKAPRNSKLVLEVDQYDIEIQRISRYYIARNGAPLFKVSPPVEGAILGAYKRKNGVSAAEYARHDPFTWNPDIHTKNKSVYEDRRTAIQAGWNVEICNNMDRFDWSNLNFSYYIEEAKKLCL